MWRTKRTLAYKSRAASEARNGMNLGEVERGLEFQRRQDRGETFRQHCLAGTRRPDQENVVATSRGDFQGSLGRLLSAHFTEVRTVVSVMPKELRRIYSQGRGRIV